MKTNIIKYLSVFFILGMHLFYGCSQAPEVSGSTPGDASTLSIRFASADMKSAVVHRSTTTPNDSSITHVTGYHFIQGVLHEILPGTPTMDGLHVFYPTKMEGEIHFVANAPSSLFESLEAGVATFDDFQSIDASIDQLCGEYIAMTGKITLQAQQAGSVVSVSLKRSVARLDLVVEESDVNIESVTINGAYDRGYIAERDKVATPETASPSVFHKEYTNGSAPTTRTTLLYLSEQTNPTLTAEVLVHFGNGMHRLTASLPSTILRNRIYTLKVHGAGTDASITVSGDDWEEGSAAETSPSLKGLIDLEASTLNSHVRVNATCDTVRIGYEGGEFRLAVRGEAGSDVSVEGAIRGVTTSVEPPMRSLEQAASISVSNLRRLPGEAQSYLYLNVYRDDVFSGRIVLVFEPNPTQLSGLLSFDETGTCDFGRYIDGQIGQIIVPKGKVVQVQFDSEDPWLKLAGSSSDTLRVLAGWKPNDPKADGRTQEGRLVISNTDGTEEESYLIRRINWGLPVVKIGETWWCKYNLRGDVKNFAEQVTIQDDAIADTELADYLATCSDDELLQLMGDQYQAGVTTGYPLRHNGTGFYYEGMKSSAQNFGTIAPTVMAPDGYQIPNRQHFAYLTKNDDHNLGGIGTRTYQNREGVEFTIRIIERQANYLGHSYGTIALYEFTTSTGCWVLNGLGHQWDTTVGNIAPMTLLLATYGNASNTWLMEGYAQAVKPNQNWLKIGNHNSTKTRVIRCVKTPVEYIYE